jgi:hypothetical protein
MEPRDGQRVRPVLAAATLLACALALGLGGGCGGGCGERSDRAEPLPATLSTERLPLPSLPVDDAPPPLTTDVTPVRLGWRAVSGERWVEGVGLERMQWRAGPGIPPTETVTRAAMVVRHAVGPTPPDRLPPIRAQVSRVAVRSVPETRALRSSLEEARRGLGWTLTRDERGRATTPTPDAPGPRLRRQAFRELTAALALAEVALPGPVAPGASWSSARDGRFPLGGEAEIPSRLETTATLRGLTTLGGRRCAVVDVQVREEFGGAAEVMAAPVDVVGVQRGRGVVWLDLDSGRPARAELSLGGRFSVQGDGPWGWRRDDVVLAQRLLVRSPEPQEVAP